MNKYVYSQLPEVYRFLYTIKGKLDGDLRSALTWKVKDIRQDYDRKLKPDQLLLKLQDYGNNG
jgi:hypothetical protein